MDQNYHLDIVYRDEQGNPQTTQQILDQRVDAIERINEVLVDGSYYPEGTTLLKVTFREPGTPA